MKNRRQKYKSYHIRDTRAFLFNTSLDLCVWLWRKVFKKKEFD